MRRAWPWLAMASVLVATIFQLHRQGRFWSCTCGRILLWTGNAWGTETSQQLFDPYSLTHVLHGVVFCGILAWSAPRLAWTWRLWLAVLAESLWEVIENSEIIIRRYREATAALGYFGDTVVNSFGDILACGLGFVIARQLGFRRSLALFLITEAVLVVWIRDSLILNILMLIYPLDGIREWQAGH